MLPKIKLLLLNASGSDGAVATFLGATLGHITSASVVNWITIVVGLLTAIKLIQEIRRNAKKPQS